jgi:hypothetical protein
VTDYSEIITLAAMSNQPNEYFTPEIEADYNARLDKVDGSLVIVASKMLAGRGYMVHTDNPETIAKYRALADHMGAAVSVPEPSWPGLRQVLLTPATKQ